MTTDTETLQAKMSMVMAAITTLCYLFGVPWEFTAWAAILFAIWAGVLK